MTFQSQGIICFEIGVTNNFVVLGTPIKKPFVSDWLAFNALAFVFWINKLPEIFCVGKIEGDVVAVKSFTEEL